MLITGLQEFTYYYHQPSGWRDRGSIPGMGKIFHLLRNAQTGTVVHPASYSKGPRFFAGGKAAGK